MLCCCVLELWCKLVAQRAINFQFIQRFIPPNLATVICTKPALCFPTEAARAFLIEKLILWLMASLGTQGGRQWAQRCAANGAHSFSRVIVKAGCQPLFATTQAPTAEVAGTGNKKKVLIDRYIFHVTGRVELSGHSFRQAAEIGWKPLHVSRQGKLQKYQQQCEKISTTLQQDLLSGVWYWYELNEF